ncbi:MFS transporter [Cytobacillus sp. NCCP-133]|uniref:MFS transporter n=1 Tax=Cytobacillus sp. NCCP-133 TaxID=766848 RepID=UPI0022329673|nr:MFS transporter [Cytobacillus sp. NCCP-133]GLB60061.1 MFS transporter [Cytobacillus sp. NCCP-133]
MKKYNSKYRWLVFGTVLFTYFLIVSQRTAPGLITDELMKEFGVTASAIGLLTSIQFFAYASLQVPIGILSDRFGPNVFLIAGTLLNGAGTLLYSFAGNEYIMFAARMLVGFGDATIWINVVIILGRWFKVNEFVKLLGFAGMSGSFGFLLATVPFSIWISLWGWRVPFFAVGVILTVLAILLYFILIWQPGRMGIAPRNSKEKKQPKEKTGKIIKRVFSDRQAWATFFCHFGVVGTYVGFIGSWAVPYGMDIYGLTRSESSQLIMIGLLGAIVGAPLMSFISGRLGVIKRPYLFAHIIVFLGWATFLVFQGKPPYVLLIVLFLIIGYGNGASALTFAVVRQSFDIKDVGVVSGFANTGGFLSAVLLPFTFGKVLDTFQSGYQYGFIIPVVFSIVGLLGASLIKEEHELKKRSEMALKG